MKKNPIRNSLSDYDLFTLEKTHWKNNQIICGVDEVGRGCFAGPVVTAAAILHPNSHNPLIQDSKKLKPKQLQEIYKWATKNCTYSIGISHNRVIDQHNIYQATKKTMKKALLSLFYKQIPDIIVIDAMPLSLKNTPYENITIHSWTKGESKSASIAIASIIAKITRDNIMNTMSSSFPQYQFAQHKGYGTQKHQQQILQYKPSIVHRNTFLKKLQEKKNAKQTQQQLFC